MPKFNSGSFQENVFTTAELNALDKSAYIGRLVYDSTVGSQAYTDGTNWIYIRPIDDTTTGGALRPFSASQGKALGDRLTAAEVATAPNGVTSKKIYFSSREEFVASLATPGAGAAYADAAWEFHFDRYYTNGPEIPLEYYRVLFNPSSLDPTAITLVAGSIWLTQRFASWGAHADQFGFLYNGTDESTRWATAIAAVRGIELPVGKTISTLSRLYVPDDKFVRCRGAYGAFQALGNMTAVLTLGSRSLAKNIEIKGNNFNAIGIYMPNTVSTAVAEDCYVHDTIAGDNPATAADGFQCAALQSARIIRPIAYRVNAGVRLDRTSKSSVDAPMIERSVYGIRIMDSEMTSVHAGMIKDCTESGVSLEGGRDCTVSGVAISRCNKGEIVFAANPTNSKVTGSQSLVVRDCTVMRELFYTSLAGATNTGMDATKAAIQINGLDAGARECGVHSCQFTVATGYDWQHAEAGTGNDRGFRIEGNSFRHEHDGALFRIVTRAQQLTHNRNIYYISTPVNTSAEWRNATRSEFRENKFIATQPSAPLIDFVTTEAATSHVISNTWENCRELAARCNLANPWDVTFTKNLFSGQFETWGGLQISGQVPPRFVEQRLFIKLSKSTAGTAETIDLYNATDFNNLFRSSGGSVYGAGGKLVLTMWSDASSAANAYEFMVGGTTLADSLVLQMRPSVTNPTPFGSASGFSKSTALFVPSAPTGASIAITKPSGAQIGFGLTAILTSNDSVPSLWTTAALPGLSADIDASNRGIFTLSGSEITKIYWTTEAGFVNGQQTTSANRPTYSSTGFNSAYPAMVCGSTGRFIDTDIPSPSSAFGFFAAVQHTTTATSGEGDTVVGSTSGGLALYIENGAMILRQPGTGNIAASAAGRVPANAPALIGVTYDLSTVRFYVNGALVDQVNTTVTLFSSRTLTLFRDRSTNATNADFNGALARLIVVGNVPSTADRDRIFGEMAHKVGLALSLPAGHSYRTTPPKL